MLLIRVDHKEKEEIRYAIEYSLCSMYNEPVKPFPSISFSLYFSIDKWVYNTMHPSRAHTRQGPTQEEGRSLTP